MVSSQDILSLDSPVGGEEDTTLGDFVEDDKYLTIVNEAVAKTPQVNGAFAWNNTLPFKVSVREK